MGERSARSCPRCGATYEDASIEFCRHDGARLPAGSGAAASEAVVDSLLGTVVAGRFRIIELLGKGGMGAVYAADHLVMKRRVALKILRGELSGDATAVARFEREAHAASRIESPDVVRLFDFGRSEDGLLYIAMEHLDGESLAARLDRDGALAPAESVRIAIPIARALEAAHRANVVHRDLKPDNVVLLRDGTVRVLDFGIARILEDDPGDGPASKLTQAGAIIGTPMYMSPEAAGRATVGPPADLYALGVMIFEMLVGRPPFDDPQPVLLMGMHLRVPPELVREARPGLEVPDALEDLVDRLLAKDPDDRPASARDVIGALEQVREAGLAATTTDGPAPEIVAQRAERRRTRRGTNDARARTERGGLSAAAGGVEGATPGPVSSTDPTPPPPSLSPGRSPWPAVGVLAVVLGAVGVAGVWAIRDPGVSGTEGARSTIGPDSSPATPAPARTLIRFAVTPTDAEVSFEGRVLANREIEIDASTRSYEVVVSADGYRTRSVRVRADVNQTIPIELAREPVAVSPSSDETDAGAEARTASAGLDDPRAARRAVARARPPGTASDRGTAPPNGAARGSVDDMFRQTKILRREGRAP